MKRFAIFAAVALAAVNACTRVQTDAPSGATAVRHAWTVPNTLRIVSGNVPRTLNPLLATQTVEASMARLTTDILVSADARGNFVPRLAREVPTRENGGISADGLTITYHLRPGVLWQDGVPFTSRDVKFTYDAIMNPDNDIVSRHGYDIVRRVDTPDPLTVVFHLKVRFAPFVSVVFGESDSPYAVLPAHVLAKYKSINDIPFNSAPMGTGPFKFVRWVRGDRIEFVRNEHYYLGAPKIERIIWRLVPDENTEMQLMRTHEADWLYEASVTAYKSIKTMPEVTVVLPPVNGYEGLMMNSGRGVTANPRVRRDIVMALDKVRLTHELTYGAGTVATGDLPPFMWAYDPQLQNLPYAPDKARSDLAALGYTAEKPLQISRRISGTPASIPIIQRSSCARIVPRTGSISHTIVRPKWTPRKHRHWRTTTTQPVSRPMQKSNRCSCATRRSTSCGGSATSRCSTPTSKASIQTRSSKRGISRHGLSR